MTPLLPVAASTLLLLYDKSEINFFCSTHSQRLSTSGRTGSCCTSERKTCSPSDRQFSVRAADHSTCINLSSHLLSPPKGRKASALAHTRGRAEAGAARDTHCSPTTLSAPALLPSSKSSPLCQPKDFSLNSDIAGFCALSPNIILKWTLHLGLKGNRWILLIFWRT